MPYRLVLEENVEHEVYHRENYGHDVEHVDFVPEVGKGDNGDPITQCSVNTDRAVVTCDGDFILDTDRDEYRAVPYIGDTTLSAKRVTDTVHAVSQLYPQEELDGVEHAGDAWL